MAELDRNGVIYIREHPTAYDLKHIGDKIGQLTAISPVIILNKEIIPRKNERETTHLPRLFSTMTGRQ